MPTNQGRHPAAPSSSYAEKTPATGWRPDGWKNEFLPRNWQSRKPDQALLQVAFLRLISARLLQKEPDSFVPVLPAIPGCADGFEPVLPLPLEESAWLQNRPRPLRRQPAFEKAHRLP